MPDIRHRVSADDFNSWRRDPRTQAVFEYLADLRTGLMEQWARGGEAGPDKQERAMAYADLQELEYADIKQFYQTEEEDEQSNEGG